MPAQPHLSHRSTPRANAASVASLPTVTFVLVWLLGTGMLQWSVVRFRVPIVLTLVLCAVALAVWQVRRVPVEPGRAAFAVVLLGSAALTTLLPVFSYLPRGARLAALTVLASGALLCAGLLCLDGRSPGRRRLPMAVAGVATLAHVTAASIAITTDPAPRIDVWVTLQQAADALGRGVNFYTVTWTGSPGIKDAFTYLPWTAALLAPGRWLGGDVRWALLLWSLVLYAGIWVLGRGTWRAAAVIAVLACLPGQLTQLDQAWTEPLLAAGIVWWAVLVRRGHAWWAVLPLALACASKQHLALLLPLLLLWRPFGWQRAVATGALTGVLIAPWFVTAPADFVHDTITLLVGFHAIRFANTLYLLALNVVGVTLPFWVTGVVVLGTLTGAGWAIWRRQPALPELLRWLALVLLVANLVNKQAFYNQFWLSAALVVMSLAAEAGLHRERLSPRDAAAPPAPATDG